MTRSSDSNVENYKAQEVQVEVKDDVELDGQTDDGCDKMKMESL